MNTIPIILRVTALVVAVIALQGAALTLIWNYIVPIAFNVSKIDFFQGCAMATAISYVVWMIRMNKEE